jgi:hypothetical protein
VAGSTPNPDAAFMAQAARRLTDAVDGFLAGHRVLICDRDAKWTDGFPRIVQDAGVTDTVALWFRGDVAGFGISDSQRDLTYNLIAGLNRRFTHVASAFVGWRYMHVDIQKGSGVRTHTARSAAFPEVCGLHHRYQRVA